MRATFTLFMVLSLVSAIGLSSASCAWLTKNTDTSAPADPNFVCHKDGEPAGASEQCCSGKTRESSCDTDPPPCGAVTCCSQGPGCA